MAINKVAFFNKSLDFMRRAIASANLKGLPVLTSFALHPQTPAAEANAARQLANVTATALSERQVDAIILAQLAVQDQIAAENTLSAEQTARQQAESARTTAEAKTAAVRQELTAAQEASVKAEKKANTLQAQVTDLDSKLTTATSQVEALTSQVTRLQEQLREVELASISLQKANDVIHSLREEFTRLYSSLINNDPQAQQDLMITFTLIRTTLIDHLGQDPAELDLSTLFSRIPLIGNDLLATARQAIHPSIPKEQQTGTIIDHVGAKLAELVAAPNPIVIAGVAAWTAES